MTTTTPATTDHLRPTGQMSTAEVNMTGVKSRRPPGKPSRFDPSEPFHMSTRRASKNPGANGTPSANGSVDGDDSQMGYFDDVAPVTSQSTDSQSPPGGIPLDDQSGPLPYPSYAYDDMLPYEPSTRGRSASKTRSPTRQTSSPPRKRQRTSSSSQSRANDMSTTDNIASNADGADASDAANFEDGSYVTDYNEADDMVDAIDPELLSDRDGYQKSNSSQSDGPDPAGEVEVDPSMDATPHISPPESPATSDSVNDENAPLAKPLSDALQEVVRTAHRNDEDAADEGDEGDEAEEGDDGDEGEEQVRWDEEGRPRRRLGGRRRAAHPNPVVEAHMRRQAQLKSAYRTIARAQKAILAEIAERTIDDLETHNARHAEVAEYAHIKEGLAAALAKRKVQLQRQRAFNKDLLSTRYEAEQLVARGKHVQRVELARDEQLDRVNLEILKTCRQDKRDQGRVDYMDATEDETEIVPRLRGMGYGWKGGKNLEDTYDSRARVGLEANRMTDDLVKRLELQQLVDEFCAQDEDAELPPSVIYPMAVMDSGPRDAALARRNLTENMRSLTAAAEEVERMAKIPVIRNEDALGLQLLGNLASRPSITSSTRDRPPIKQRWEIVADGTPPSRHLPLPIPSDPHLNAPMRFSLSPRAAHALDHRPEYSMPPPSTPQQVYASHAHPSSSVGRHELPPPVPFPLPLPPTQPSRHEPNANGLGRILGPMIDSWPPPPPPRQSQQYESFRPLSFPPPPPPREPSLDVFPSPPQHPSFSATHHPLWREYPPHDPGHRHEGGSGPPPFPPYHGGLVYHDERRAREMEDHRRAMEYHYEEERRAEHMRATPWRDDPLHYGPPDSNVHGHRRSSAYESVRQDSSQHPPPPLDLRPLERRPSLSESMRQTPSDRPKSSHSRQSSSSISAMDTKAGAQQPEGKPTRRKRGRGKDSNARKASKAEKGDGGRRQTWSQQWNVNKPKPESATPSTPAAPAASYAESPREQPRPSSWSDHPSHDRSSSVSGPLMSLGSPYVPRAYAQPSSRTLPEPEHLGRPLSYYYRTDNYPLVPPPPLPPGWTLLPPPHIPPPPSASHYGPAQPPPPGVPEDQYSQVAPPPPPSYSTPASAPLAAAPPPAQSPTESGSSYSRQFGGALIAPASNNPTPDRPSTGRLPAFAQRVAAPGGPYRRRTGSDGFHVHKFHHYNSSGSGGAPKGGK